ncbi:helix-turn-helix domain-containing protein [Kocuria sp.]|uniref:winged helix-turn-helix transcriptional regulator n=1 Tax=Kocuria sp. TaxID=1871328 RepID=UPI0026DD27B9|nr:helix-turn-helix domain-containing protein [Kocuria sp.]MDO4919611.1 helix-turn-helix domain-containing protein [Kocuria sp.]
MVTTEADVYAKACPCRGILDRVADKWTALIIGRLEQGPLRFNELRRSIEGISQKMLTQNLRTLERDGLVRRTVFDTAPVTVQYELTDLGATLIEPLAGLRAWSEQHKASVVNAQQSYDRRVPTAVQSGPV